MNVFDMIGPVMVGPSSSHTAGAVRIGLAARKLLGEDVAEANIFFHGSFWATGKGHGTDQAVIAGLIGMDVADERIPESFILAKEQGMVWHFDKIDLGEEVHPNTVYLEVTGKDGRSLTLVASSVGGGQILIVSMDELKVNVSGDSPTLIVHNIDESGHVAAVTSLLGKEKINIAAMQLYRLKRGGKAVMVIECDEHIPETYIHQLEQFDGIWKVTYLDMLDQHWERKETAEVTDGKAKEVEKYKLHMPQRYMGKQGARNCRGEMTEENER